MRRKLKFGHPFGKLMIKFKEKFEIGQIVERTVNSIAGSGQWLYVVLGEGDLPQRLSLYCLKAPPPGAYPRFREDSQQGKVLNMNTFYLREYKNES